jgi:small subunit ribosomal protein S1
MSRFEDLHVGDVVTGHVMKVLPFGVFVALGDEAIGLLAGDDRPQAGSSVTVRIAEMDTLRRRAKLVLP